VVAVREFDVRLGVVDEPGPSHDQRDARGVTEVLDATGELIDDAGLHSSSSSQSTYGSP